MGLIRRSSSPSLVVELLFREAPTVNPGRLVKVSATNGEVNLNSKPPTLRRF